MLNRTWEDPTSATLLEANYNGMHKAGKKIAKYVDSRREIHVVGKLGTNFVSNIEGRKSRVTDFAGQPRKIYRSSFGEWTAAL